jgi:hypothetical protein
MAAVEKGPVPSARGKAAVHKAVQRVMHDIGSHSRKKAPPAVKRRRDRVAAT